MLSRVTIDIPRHMADAIERLATDQFRNPKQQIIWLLNEALRHTSRDMPPQVRDLMPSNIVLNGGAHDG